MAEPQIDGVQEIKKLMSPWDELDERVRRILFAVVENYIETAEPVGSRTLSKSLELGLSAATIRNVMADLTELGYLEQPHTSAGRVPTNQAYRYYVNVQGLRGPLPAGVEDTIEAALLESGQSLEQLLATTTKLLAGTTHFTGLVASPRVDATRLRLVEFIRLSERKVYVVLITAANMVHHRVIEVSEPLSQAFLDKVSGYFNEHFAYRTLDEVRQRMLDSLVEDKAQYDQMLAQAVRLSKRAFELSDVRELYVEGHANLVQEFNDVDKIQHLLEALDEKVAIIDLLDRTLNAGGVNVAIGLASPLEHLADCALVTASYGNGESVLGAIGVLGPTRMNYSRVVPVIDYTARVLSRAISDQ